MLVRGIYGGGSLFFDQSCAALGSEPAHPAGGSWTCWLAWGDDALSVLQPHSCFHFVAMLATRSAGNEIVYIAIAL
jgi:hypothetical protein